MNLCILTGRLTRDPKGYDKSGKEVTNCDNEDLRFTAFNLVVNSGYGEYKTTMLINCKIQDYKLASWALSKLYKGVEVVVEGSLYEYSYKSQQGTVNKIGLKLKSCEISRHTKEYLEYKNMGSSDEYIESERDHMIDTSGNEVDSEGFMMVNPNECELPFD